MTALLIVCALVALVTIKHWIGPVLSILMIIGTCIAAAAALVFVAICYFLAPFEMALRAIYRQTIGRIRRTIKRRSQAKVDRFFNQG